MRFTITLAAGVTAALAFAGTADAKKDAAPRADCKPSLERKYQSRYREVRQRHGRRAPGRNIGLWGVVKRNQTVREARCAELRESAHQLRVLLTVPKPPLVRVAQDPPQMPSGVQSPGVGLDTGGYAIPPQSIAACESGGDPTTDTGNGFYGKWQFTLATWRAVTGLPGKPSSYSEAIQDAAAARLYRNGAGAGNWPVCAYR